MVYRFSYNLSDLFNYNIILYYERTLKILKDYIVLNVRIPREYGDLEKIREYTNNVFDSYEEDIMYELTYKYELSNDKNSKEETRILSTSGENYEYKHTIKNSLLYVLAKENGTLDDLVKNFQAIVSFNCYIFPDEYNLECNKPFVFYNSTIDFIKRLNACVYIWPQK